MAIGNPVDGGSLNARLGDGAVTIRQASLLGQEIWEFINTLGANQAAIEAALQQPPYNMSAPDSASFYQAAYQLETLANAYFGAGTIPTAFNYDEALSIARGINP